MIVGIARLFLDFFSDIELPLRSAHGEIEPTTKGGHVQVFLFKNELLILEWVFIFDYKVVEIKSELKHEQLKELIGDSGRDRACYDLFYNFVTF